jgi:hypothetical protein
MAISSTKCVHMKELYLANCKTFLDKDEFPGSSHWAEIYKLINTNTVLVDRSQDIVLPYRFKLAEFNRLPTDLDNFNMTYEQCCDQRAVELYEKSKRMDLPLYVFYSGGIDSTLVITSFLRNIPHHDLDRLVVVMSLDSIRENPKFYYNHIRKNLKTISSEKMSMLFDKRALLVGGEHNDQLFGTDVISEFSNKFDFSRIHEPYTRETVTEFYSHLDMTPEGSNIWYDLIDQHAQKAPIEIKSIFEYFWWLNFNFKWQSVFFRMLLRIDVQARQKVDAEFVEQYFHHFYSESYFQKWSMLNKGLKIKENWATYKWTAKELIYDYTKDDEYAVDKQKAPSLYKLFLQKHTPTALTSDYKYIYDLEPSEFYVPDNSFVR